MMDFVSFISLTAAAATVLTFALALALILVRWIRRRRRRPVTIRFLRGKGRRFESSFRLYEHSFPWHERDEKKEVQRWLSEYHMLRKRSDEPLAEYWVSNFRAGRACALFYGTLYPKHGIMFVSYYAVVEGLKDEVQKQVKSELETCVRSAIADDGHKCDAIVAEVEHPDLAPDGESRNERLARIRLLVGLAFRAGIELVLLKDAPYVQPKLNPDDHTKREETMLLLYGQLGRPAPVSVPRVQAARILTFVYQHLYADCFMDEAAKDGSWREYVADLCREATGKLPPTIRCTRAF